MNLVPLAARVDEPAIRELLSYTVGVPSPERLAWLCARYREAGWHLLGIEEEGRPVGLIGLECTAPGWATIQHIAVAPGKRHRGIGRTLIAQAALSLGVERLAAETDADAVDFYRRCGFVVESLGERYPGVERFRCTREE